MRKLFVQLNEALKNGEDTVLVTIIASSGSTPRGMGAKMLVGQGGRLCGTIGGGAIEHHCEQTAIDVLRSKSSHIGHFRLHKNQIQDLGMICGGDVSVYFRYMSAGDGAMLGLTEKIEDMYRKPEQAWLISELTGNGAGEIGVYGVKSGLYGASVPEVLIESLGNKPFQMEADSRMFYCEKLVQAGRVYIFGGGHVGQALVPALTAVEFDCVVLEDREEFCKPELFAGLAETRLIDNDNLFGSVSVTEDDYVVIMTRGHKDDEKIQAQVLNTPVHYIGVIGSRKKTAGVFANLRGLGFTDSDLSRITTPIGLDIKAETPAEIAVSITAQMILARANHLKR